jgi:hypothetical protein
MDDAIRDLERVSGDAELPGGEVNEQGAHLGARHAQRGAALLDRLAAGGLPLIGVRPVSPEIIVTRASGTSSSSAAIWASAVTMPCPSSTLPVNTVTLPSALMRSQASSVRLVCRLPGSRAGPARARLLERG